jgi:hypothetical protein
MTTQTVQASFMLSTGEVVDLESSLTDGTEGELKVSTDYAVAATSIGQFADGKVITQIIQPVQGATGITYAYLDRRGEILMVLPVSCAGVESQPVMPYSMPVLQAGDTIRVLCNVADTRTFAYNVITNTGVHAIFTGTPSGAANTALTHIKSGQGLGQSLTGQTIVRHMSTSVDGAKLDSALSKRAKARLKVMSMTDKKKVESAAKTLFNNEMMGVKRMQEIVRWCKKC